MERAFVEYSASDRFSNLAPLIINTDINNWNNYIILVNVREKLWLSIVRKVRHKCWLKGVETRERQKITRISVWERGRKSCWFSLLQFAFAFPRLSWNILYFICGYNQRILGVMWIQCTGHSGHGGHPNLQKVKKILNSLQTKSGEEHKCSMRLNVCRLCLSGEDLFWIYDKNVECEGGMDLQEIVFQTSGVKVSSLLIFLLNRQSFDSVVYSLWYSLANL